MVVEQLLLVLGKVVQLKLELKSVVALHDMLVVVGEQEPVSVEAACLEGLLHDEPDPYTFAPCL
jgi:hypothetical protein